MSWKEAVLTRDTGPKLPQNHRTSWKTLNHLVEPRGNVSEAEQSHSSLPPRLTASASFQQELQLIRTNCSQLCQTRRRTYQWWSGPDAPKGAQQCTAVYIEQSPLMCSFICSPRTALVVLNHTQTHKNTHTHKEDQVETCISSTKLLPLQTSGAKTLCAKETTLGMCRMWITFKAKKRNHSAATNKYHTHIHTHTIPDLCYCTCQEHFIHDTHCCSSTWPYP